MFQSSNFIFITHKSIVTLAEYGNVSKHTLMDEVFIFSHLVHVVSCFYISILKLHFHYVLVHYIPLTKALSL
jgi:hypothetical protein